ncbi:MAG: cobalamin biosynthesis protein CobD [Candidatus Nitronauta litoralis]|uniref:Cobalamin biosynthesis protein CobD n=1 Tax=Candidatus Nitronauta litoralis TaxID=2705533 RepID=A0A7T0G211_9BACT|nr:MAG: cobalamin biosynthesis protein CobD [Candidatus Nitronauta litoralis]
MTSETFALISIAFLLDLVLGDPRKFPHPVKGIGWLAARMENLTRKFFSAFTAGTISTLTVVGVAYGIIWFLLEGATLIHPTVNFVVEAFLIYTTLSVRSLFDESRPVFQSLKSGDLPAARNWLSRIVGRDTANLNQNEISRATVETISESYVDGVLAPLLFAFIGGAPLAMGYKAVNTLDSMFGYRNQRYREFGTFPARLDDVANWVPARLSAVLLPVATFITGHNGWRALTTALRDGRKHLSPNSGFPEAAMAGALGVQLGGTSSYQGTRVSKPTLGESTRDIEQDDIKQSQIIMLTASVLAVFLFCIVSLLIH